MFSPNKLRADSVVEKRALIENRLPAEIPEHESDNVEHGRRFQDHRVLPCGESPAARPIDRLARRGLGQRQRIEVAHVGRIRLLPAGGILAPAW